jgi:hypothetical protein
MFSSVAVRCRSASCWEGLHVAVDNETTVEQLEIVASYIVAKIKANAKYFGGDYRVWLSDSLPGQKLRVDVWYSHATPGTTPRLLHCEHVQ